MNIYKTTMDYILNLPVLKAWPEAAVLLKHAASKQPRDWRLPLFACQAVGGTTGQGIPAVASIACALIGILLIDDMLDDDPRGEFQRIGPAQTSNFASVFLAASTQAIVRSGVESGIKLQAVESLQQMIISVAFGQFLDIQNPTTETAYWKVVRMKSAPFFRTTLELGALFGEAPVEVVHGMGEIGFLYGEMIQIHDDMNDSLATPAGPDWIQRRSPLPILYAQQVKHANRKRFLELRQRTLTDDVLNEMQEILIKSGAISYCIDQLLYRYQEALAVSTRLKIVHPEKLNVLLEEVIVPVWGLFEGSTHPQSLFIEAARNWQKME
jgi:geranylgeranyl pyrophosphate synthase